MNIHPSPAYAVRNFQPSSRSLLLSAFVVLAAMLALVVVPSSANAFGIKNFKYENVQAPDSTMSPLQAAGHPNVKISFERTGSESEDLKNVDIKMPKGVFPNPEAATTKCTEAKFKADQCPSASNVGKVTVDVKAMSLLPMTIHGSVDVLAPTATSTSVATLGLTLRPEKICILFIFCAVPEKIQLTVPAKVDTYNGHNVAAITGDNPKTSTIGIPLIVWTPTIDGDITVNKMALELQSRAGDWTTRRECKKVWFWTECTDVPVPPSGPYFWAQTPSCTTATATATLISYQNVSATASSSFTPTGCDSVPFDWALEFTPANNDSNTSTAVSFKMTQPDPDAPIEQAFPKFVDADLPAGSGLDLNAMSGVDNCSETELRAHNCPASSQIGTAYSFSKFMPGTPASQPGLTGKVYAMSVTSQIDMAVQLDGPRNTVIVLRGTMGARNGRVYSVFDDIPQVPFREFGLTITKTAYKNPAECGTATSSVKLIGYNGTAATNGNGTEVTRSTSYTVDECATPPETTITGKPLEETTLTKAPFEFTSDQPGSTFQCSIDGGAWSACTSPMKTQALTLGDHTFRVKALKGVVEDLSPAEYGFKVIPSDYQIEADVDASDYQAVAHPDIDAAVSVIGNGQPKDLSVKMPRGLAASLAAVELCDSDAGAVGNCPIESKIGTVDVTIKKVGGATEVGSGTIYLTDALNDVTDAGGVAATVQFADGTLIATGGAFLVENGAHQYLELRNIPNTLNGNEFQATQLTLHLDGVTDEGANFITNPSNCDANAFEASSIDHNDNEAAAVTVPFQATGCDLVPFGPVLTQTLTNPVAGQTTGVVASLVMPVDNAAIATLQVDEPRVIKPNFPAFGDPLDQCSQASITDEGLFAPTPDNCPEQAKVGTMTLNTPLLPDPLVGQVYLIEASPIPWLGVSFNEPGINVSMVGITSTPKINPACNPLVTPGGCPTRISISFDGVPDVQITDLTMDLSGSPRTGNGGVVLPGEILALASPNDPGCKKNSLASSTIWSHADPDNSIVQDQNISVPTCNNP